MKNRNTQLAAFYLSALLAALILYAAPVKAAEHPKMTRQCVCKEHGPRGGCVRWSCRSHRWDQ